MFKPGDFAFSPGGNFLYEILSYPFCRLYYAPGNDFEFQPHSFERKLPEHKFNYVSYIVRLEAEWQFNLEYRFWEWVEIVGERFELTDRCLIGEGNAKATVRKRVSDADGAGYNTPNVA